jgi:hypothetical protein
MWNILVEEQLMSENNKKVNESNKECRMDTTDSQGHSNLCCCYVLQEDGSYVDPCYIPVDHCC